MRVIKILRLIYIIIYWYTIKKIYRINEKTVVIFVPEVVYKWNAVVLKYLPTYIKRKSAEYAIVFATEDNQNDIRELCYQYCKYNNVDIKVINRIKMKRLMDYYCLYRFFDSIVFFFLNYPKDDNRSYYILGTTDVTMKELVCLGFYHLREVPKYV